MLRWEECDRERLSAVLEQSVVVLAVGAIEQHGPHLATGTDSTLAQRLVLAACERVDLPGEAEVVVAPGLPFGVSEHHLPFGGTLSLRASTMLAVLSDLLRSMVVAGARRLVVVNGHGGNVGVVHAACAEVSAANDGVAVGSVNYWDLVDRSDVELNVPGHAGRFETSMMLATGWTPSGEPMGDDGVDRPNANAGTGLAMTVHSQRRWRDIQGCSDDPATADIELGRRLFEHVVHALVAELTAFAEEAT